MKQKKSEIGKKVAKQRSITFGSEEERVMRDIWKNEKPTLKRFKEEIVPVLEKEYYTGQKSLDAVAKQVKMPRSNIQRYMGFFGMPTFRRSEAHKMMYMKMTPKQRRERLKWKGLTKKQRKERLGWGDLTEKETKEKTKRLLDGYIGISGRLRIKIPKQYQKEYQNTLERLIKGEDPKAIARELDLEIDNIQLVDDIMSKASAEAFHRLKQQEKAEKENK